VIAHEAQWAELMRAANRGDAAAYAQLLAGLLPSLRALARRAVARAGGAVEAEDIVQETLLAIHLKRHTWIETEPLGPWMRAIAHHKLIDALRRRGRRVYVPFDEVEDLLPSHEQVGSDPRRDVERHLPQLPERQRDVVRAIALEGQSIRNTAQRFNTTEGAVRVALHRGVTALAAVIGKGGL
jgi:RNA polymerase sigma-70 factor (ECF subfamily)